MSFVFAPRTDILDIDCTAVHRLARTRSYSRASEVGVCRGSDTPNYLCGGDIDMYISLEKPNT